jgi:hypothetical protein
VQPGRIVAIGRSGRRLALVYSRTLDGVTAMREDGRFSSFPLQRVGRVFAPIFSTRPERAEEAFDGIHDRGDQLALPEPKLRDAQAGEDEAIKLINDAIDALAPAQAVAAEREGVVATLWSLQAPAVAMKRRIARSRICVRTFGSRRAISAGARSFWLSGLRQRKSYRTRQVARDLRVDRPLLIGEALQRNLFASLDATHAAALIAALAADEDRDYGELELEDAIVSCSSSSKRFLRGIDRRMEARHRGGAGN